MAASSTATHLGRSTVHHPPTCQPPCSGQNSRTEVSGWRGAVSIGSGAPAATGRASDLYPGDVHPGASCMACADATGRIADASWADCCLSTGDGGGAAPAGGSNRAVPPSLDEEPNEQSSEYRDGADQQPRRAEITAVYPHCGVSRVGRALLTSPIKNALLRRAGRRRAAMPHARSRSGLVMALRPAFCSACAHDVTGSNHNTD
jgi:hypothetical protein